MLGNLQARADWRALTSAALIGSGIGLALGSAYLAGGMARTATDHARAARLAAAAEAGFSEAMLRQEAASMDPGILKVAEAHDPSNLLADAPRERQSALLAARLERQTPRPIASAIALRAAFTSAYTAAAAPYRLAGVLDSSRELECLTQAVYFEARGETAAGQAAVAQVVLNRVRNPAFPKSVCGVVFQGAARGVGCQFSFACDGSMRKRREEAAWTRAQQVASRALSGGVMGAVGNATHFHTIHVDPSWAPNLLRVAQVGLHVFYRFGHPASPAEFAEAIAPPPEEAAAPPELRLATAVAVAPEPVSEAPAASEHKAAEPAAKITPTSQVREPLVLASGAPS